MTTKEWSENKIYNPFNSWKAIAHIDRFKLIERGKPLPPPVTISSDLSSRCNARCNFCNAHKVLTTQNSMMSEDTIKKYIDFLNDWEVGGYKVRSTCIGGNGESTLNRNLRQLIGGLSDIGIKSGLVTNGISMKPLGLDRLDWIGVSVDAGTSETYKRIKGVDQYQRVLDNIKYLSKLGGILNSSGQGHGISYKYLLHPDNINEVYQAAKNAKDYGCRNLQIRPVSDPWDRKLNIKFTQDDLNRFSEQLDRARSLEDKDFGVFGLTHKFSGDFQPDNDFNKCYGILMNCAISPSRKEGYLFTYNACCDNRANEPLVKDFKSFDDFKKYWGSDEHWNMAMSINPKSCPRCTLKSTIKLYEKGCLEDNLTYEFI